MQSLIQLSNFINTAPDLTDSQQLIQGWLLYNKVKELQETCQANSQLFHQNILAQSHHPEYVSVLAIQSILHNQQTEYARHISAVDLIDLSAPKSLKVHNKVSDHDKSIWDM
eukprot:12558736-Ditylum_brightwellii.AAC.1